MIAEDTDLYDDLVSAFGDYLCAISRLQALDNRFFYNALAITNGKERAFGRFSRHVNKRFRLEILFPANRFRLLKEFVKRLRIELLRHEQNPLRRAQPE